MQGLDPGDPGGGAAGTTRSSAVQLSTPRSTIVSSLLWLSQSPTFQVARDILAGEWEASIQAGRGVVTTYQNSDDFLRSFED